MARPHLGHLTLVSRDPRDLQQFTDELWARLRREAEDAYQRAPQLASLFLDSIINQGSFEGAVTRAFPNGHCKVDAIRDARTTGDGATFVAGRQQWAGMSFCG